MTRTIRQPYNSSHIPAMSPKERFARNGAEAPMKPMFKKQGGGSRNWGRLDEVYPVWEGKRDVGVKVQIMDEVLAARYTR